MNGLMQPPRLQGYDFMRLLGSGTTSTVFLYHWQELGGPVAIKVCNAPPGPHPIAQSFSREIGIMARVPSHPHILRPYGVGVTEDGFGFMAVEYAPGGTYLEPMRSRALTCPQVLELGVMLAGALSTIHRSGIVHRDIKPSNILITDRGLPALGDFSIATDDHDSAETGFSLPWAPPEVLRHSTNGTQVSDVYSLAATLYAMFVGCSPYQHEYRPQSHRELTDLILDRPLPRIGESTIPWQVETVLIQALHKDPDRRFQTALDFARALQRVQYAQYGAATPVVVEGIAPYPLELERSDRLTDRSTRLLHGSMQPAQDSAQLPHGPKPEPDRLPTPARPATASPAGKPRPSDAAGTHRSARRRNIRIMGIAAVTAAVLVIAVMAATKAVIVSGNHLTGFSSRQPYPDSAEDPTGNDSTQEHDSAPDGTGNTVPAPQRLQGTYATDGSSVSFSWENPDPLHGDSYAWSLVQDENESDRSVSRAFATKTPQATVDAHGEPRICIRVSIVREDNRMSTEPAVACAVRDQ